MRRAMWVAAAAIIGLSGCASRDTIVTLQRPRLPSAMVFAAAADHRLYRSVTIDYISGMSQRSLWFAKANQRVFRPALETALAQSGLMAPSADAARYGLQVEFTDLQGPWAGADLRSRSRAIYRIVERHSGRVIFERPIEAEFLARFVGLRAEDAAPDLIAGPVAEPWSGHELSPGSPLHSFGHSLTKAASVAISGGTGDAVATAFREDYQVLLISRALGALAVLSPTNFIAAGDIAGAGGEVRAQTLRGDLSSQGFGGRDASLRAAQANYQMTRQSIARFLIALSQDEHVPMTILVPCLDNAEVRDLKSAIEARGQRWATDDCLQYRAPLGQTAVRPVVE